MIKAFISIQALLIVLAIGAILLQSAFVIDSRKDYAMALYFQKQSFLYAIFLKDIAFKCIKDKATTKDYESCSENIDFNDYFHGKYKVKVKNDIIVDILIDSQNLLSTHPLKYVKRYIIKD